MNLKSMPYLKPLWDIHTKCHMRVTEVTCERLSSRHMGKRHHIQRVFQRWAVLNRWPKYFRLPATYDAILATRRVRTSSWFNLCDCYDSHDSHLICRGLNVRDKFKIPVWMRSFWVRMTNGSFWAFFQHSNTESKTTKQSVPSQAKRQPSFHKENISEDCEFVPSGKHWCQCRWWVIYALLHLYWCQRKIQARTRSKSPVSIHSHTLWTLSHSLHSFISLSSLLSNLPSSVSTIRGLCSPLPSFHLYPVALISSRTDA